MLKPKMYDNEHLSAHLRTAYKNKIEADKNPPRNPSCGQCAQNSLVGLKPKSSSPTVEEQ